jgi:hypothetical protein
MLRARWRSPLLADRSVTDNRYGTLWNYGLPSMARVVGNLMRSRDGFALDGPMDELLIGPWLAHLIAKGMQFRSSTFAERVAAHRDGVLVRANGKWEEYNGVVVATYLPDLLPLVATTGRARGRAALPHTHCVCLTATLEPGEDVITRGEVSLYCRDGFSVLVQPGASRCVALCVRPRTTNTTMVLHEIREILGLRYEIQNVQRQDNSLPAESIFTAEHLRVAEVLAAPVANVAVAGSYLRTTYPLDSAECAVRSAVAAVDQLAGPLLGGGGAPGHRRLVSRHATSDR